MTSDFLKKYLVRFDSQSSLEIVKFQKLKVVKFQKLGVK